MNFIDAMTALTQGKKVKLPEWTGYWFENDENEVMVLTKQGDIQDSPWLEKYQGRTDWEITEGNMGFDFAILALKAGKKVARKGWNGKGMFIFMQKGYPDGIPANKNTSEALGIAEGTEIKVTPYLMMKAADGTLVTGWLASQTDMLAEDWEIAQ